MRVVRLGVVGWALLFPGIVLAQLATFETSTTTSVDGVRPTAVVVVDLDGDQHLDAVTANSDRGSISVLTGDGSGFLNFFGTFDAGTVPLGLVVDDFDQDTQPDVIVANGTASTLSFLKQIRDPDLCDFGAPFCFQLARDPISGVPIPIPLPGVCTGDSDVTCDPDVRMDLCEVNGKGTCGASHMCSGDPTTSCDPAVLVDGCGAVGKGTCSGVGGPGGLASGDLDGDPFRDVVVASQGNGEGDGKVSVLFGRGDGTFDAVPPMLTGSGSASAVTAVVVADLDGDQDKDIAVVDSAGDNVSVFLNLGARTFGPRLDSSLGNGAAPTGLAVGNIDESGPPDLVVAVADGITVMVGDGHGHFTRGGTFTAGNTPSAVNLIDVNGDGHLDAVVSNSRSADVSVLLGDGHGHFARARTFVADGEPLAVAVGDLDEDHFPDVVTANAATAGADVAVMLNRGCSPLPCQTDGSLIGVEDFHVGQGVTGIAAGDFNNDSFPDIAVTFGASSARIYLAATDRNFVATDDVQVGENPIAVAVADFNRDGNLDLATVSSGDAGSNGSVSIVLGRGNGTFAMPHPFATAASPVSLVVGDFNNDRIPDLAVVSNTAPGLVSILLGHGDGTFANFVTAPTRDGSISLAVGYFNNDLFQDLVVANGSKDNVSVLLGAGTSTFHNGGTVAVGRGPVGITVLDSNRDGVDDFAVAHMTDQNVRVCTSDSSVTPSFTCSLPVAAGNTPSALVARDFGRTASSSGIAPDIAVANQVSNSVSILVNNAAGRFTPLRPDVTVSRQPKVITAADFDGDGRCDIATGNASTATNVSVLHNHGATPVRRGDGNGDGRVSAADLIAAEFEVTDVKPSRSEDVARGDYAASPGVDANGDGAVTPQDIRATASRIFVGS